MQSCYEQDVSSFATYCEMQGLESDTALIKALCKWTRLAPSVLAREAGMAATTLTRPYAGTATTRVSQPTLDKLKARFPAFPGWKNEEPDLPDAPLDIEYVQVEVMPTYAGAGGGGTGEGDVEQALIPRYLIEGVFRGRPSDFVMVRVRGTSMEPLFKQDDELLIDKRDRDPSQGGPFAIWDADGEQYIVKNIERLGGGRVRVFSENPAFTPQEVQHEGTRILGRPVWFARRL